jgi:hypothetical protein
VAHIAAAITGAESDFTPSAVQKGQPYATTGWGLWQITPGNSVPQFGTNNQLLNPHNNAEAAVYKYEAGGGSFAPWTTYGSGAYLKFMANGGMITEPIAGIGKSGQRYMFGEAGNELVTPMGGANAAIGSGGDTYIINVNANNCIDPNAVAQNIHQVMRRYKNKKGGGPLGLS